MDLGLRFKLTHDKQHKSHANKGTGKPCKLPEIMALNVTDIGGDSTLNKLEW